MSEYMIFKNSFDLFLQVFTSLGLIFILQLPPRMRIQFFIFNLKHYEAQSALEVNLKVSSVEEPKPNLESSVLCYRECRDQVDLKLAGESSA